MRSSDWQPARQDTVTAVLRRAVERYPEQTYLIMPDGRLTYAEAERRSNALAHGLKARGVKAGDTVSTILDNNIDCILAWYAVNKLGAIWVPVNTAYKGEFLRHQLADAGAGIIIAEPDYAERIQPIEDGLPALREVYVRGTAALQLQRTPMQSLSGLYSDDESAHADVNRPADLSMLIYTGGTTGPSKGCMISHNYACSLGRQALDVSGRTRDELHWSCLPLFHFNATACTALNTAMIGGTCFFTSRFSVSGFWASIEESGAKLVNLIGSMIPLLSNAPDEPAMARCKGQVRAVLGAPFPEQLQQIWKQRFGVQVAGSATFGLTESSLITSLPMGQYYKPGSCGKRNELFDVCIFDDESNELPAGTAGEIVVRPLQPNVMFDGYWKRPADTLKVFRDLWFHTGDVGKFDDDGYLFFVDRKKDYLRRGGENISSYEMESTLGTHPDIQEVAVHAVLSPLSEDEVKATVVLRDAAAVTERELCLWIIERVPYFAVPRYIEFRPDLPKSPLGRVLKYELRDQGCTPTTWDRNRSDIKLAKR